MPAAGVVVLHSLQFDPPPARGKVRRCNNSLHSFVLGSMPASPGAVSPPFLGHVARIEAVAEERRQVSLSLQPA
jgi:hypothetical protein